MNALSFSAPRLYVGNQLALMDESQFEDSAESDRPPIVWTPERELLPTLRSGILAARQSLLSLQTEEGTWCGEQQGDASLTARLMLAWAYLKVDDQRADRLANEIKSHALPTGGWAARPGGEAELSVSVLCYFALKQHDATKFRPELHAARRVIRRLGGLKATGEETQAWLSLFGQVDPFAAAADSPWHLATQAEARQTISPLRGVRELLIEGQNDRGATASANLPGEAIGLIWQRLAADDSRFAAELDRQLERLIVDPEESDWARLVPTRTTSIDTAITLFSLVQSGLSDSEHSVVAARRALLTVADLTVGASGLRDTAVLLRALSATCDALVDSDALPPELRVRDSSEQARAFAGATEQLKNQLAETMQQLVHFLIEQQAADGSWGSSDVTAVVLLSLLESSGDVPENIIEQGVHSLRQAQLADGSWPSTWAVGTLHGTSLAMQALVAAAANADANDDDDEAVLAGANWLLVEQQPSGGWGEPVNLDPAPGREADADCTASQTAWALNGLVAAGWVKSEAAHHAVQFLLDTQEETGEWQEPHFTLLNDAGGAMKRHSLYATALPLQSLAAWSLAANQLGEESESAGLQLFGV